jgi:hypothetical protein
VIQAALREWRDQIHAIPPNRQMTPRAMRSRVSAVHRAGNLRKLE